MIETSRLLLRPWRESDKDAFAAIINTPAMMAHFGGVQPRSAIDLLIDSQMRLQARDGFSMWAVELRANGALGGICGVRHDERYANTPCADDLEIGWRIAEPLWGQGVAREAATAAIGWGWANTGFARLSAWTTADNRRSWGLMERLGMTRRADLDFRQPAYRGSDDPLGDMVVYSLDRPA